jgi:hypothetical protein
MAFSKDADPIKDMNIGAKVIIDSYKTLCTLDKYKLRAVKYLIEKEDFDRIVFGDKVISDYDKGMQILIILKINEFIHQLEEKEFQENMYKSLQKLF